MSRLVLTRRGRRAVLVVQAVVMIGLLLTGFWWEAQVLSW